MEDLPIKQIKDIYGLNPNIPHLALQFPRLPPGLSNPMFKIFENPMNEKFAKTIHQSIKNYKDFSNHIRGMRLDY